MISGDLLGIYLDFAGITAGISLGFSGGTLAKIRLQGPSKVVAICSTFELLIAKLSLFAIL